jgi:hypothetical protein
VPQYGNSGSTLADELNRLANGGTYPVITSYKDLAGAANAWAGTTGKDIVGALNVKAGNTLQAYKDLAGVCNQLAGTSGLEAAAALRWRAS